MKTLFLNLALIGFAIQGLSQDIIVKNDSTRIRATVQEIGPTQVKYRWFDYPNGPLITDNKCDLAYILFPNGHAERFPKSISAIRAYDPNAYNLDRVPVVPYNPDALQKRNESFYRFRNYIGFNYIACLNATFGLHYMRDFRKAHLLLDLPLAIGLGKPSITNGLYGGNYLDGTRTTSYERMNYQAGLSALFAPSVKLPVNFLLGPSISFTEYRMQVQSQWFNQMQTVEFTNSFRLYRAWYGVSLGLMARFTPRFNTCVLMGLGYNHDRYNKDDPYGAKVYQALYNKPMPLNNSKAYVHFSWTLGYRF